MGDLTVLLAAARDGNKDAAGEAFSLLYNELRQIARSRLRQHQPFTLLDTTSLVHESYLKLVGVADLPIQDRKHFFTYASTVMRSVIVDFARSRAAERRGGDSDHLVLDTELSEKLGVPEDDVIKVDEAMKELAQVDMSLATQVEMRYFGGLTEIEIADALGISERTVRRNWDKAKLILGMALR